MNPLLPSPLSLLPRTVAGIALVALSVGAQASLIVNGDFETGNLNGWTTYTTAGGTIGVPAVSAFDTSGAGASNAAMFNVGRVIFGVGASQEGGGLFQSFMFGGGMVNIAADIAVLLNGGGRNLEGGLFSLLLDGSVVDSFDFGDVFLNVAERSTLDYAGLLSAGNHELRFEITRGFTTGDVSPFQYLDNVVVTGGNQVPEPGTLALVGLALAGVGWARRATR